MVDQEQVRKKPKLATILPYSYIACSQEHLILLLVTMFESLIEHNDKVPLEMSNTTRFHSRSVPAINLLDYLRRICKYVVVEKSVLLVVLIWVDRMCALYPSFVISSLTAHR